MGNMDIIIQKKQGSLMVKYANGHIVHYNTELDKLKSIYDELGIKYKIGEDI